MASHGTEQKLLGRVILQFTLDLCESHQPDRSPTGTNGDPKIRVPTFIFSNPLPISRDSSDFTTLYLEDLAECKRRGSTYNVEEGIPFTSCSWCSSITFATKGEWHVSFNLQLNFGPQFQGDKALLVLNCVGAMCSLVKWEDRLVLAIDSRGPTENLDCGRLEQSIGEDSEITFQI
ncbi:hypothetical protein FSARC_11234 [Fusarium sarcochroum]|uniref:Uncharacterized protein n=1 Tax=Fusarium sarcochroum TaxID=1208366 RepID=A0A8H4X0S4_9HYPO|nr:hypothetical protein FSARC_11234 [Fusarium sarcochroum]